VGVGDAVGDWMLSNRLQLNGDKTEFMWLTTAQRQQRLPTLSLTIGSTSITPCKAAHDVGVYIDADLTMQTHVQRTVSCCFAPAAHHPTLSAVTRVSTTGRCTRSHPAGLL